MRIFVTGGTGVIGRPSVVRLVAAGHDVTVLARSSEKAAQVTEAGATPVEVSLFDPAGLRAAVAGHDAVVNLATHIPPLSKAARASAWMETERIRREGSTNLVDAAIEAGAAVFVQESLAFYYPDSGDRWIDERAPLEGGDIIGGIETAEANVARFTQNGGKGVVLRFGRFYDSTSNYSRPQVRAATLGISGEMGAPDGYQPLIDIRDGATAVVAALDAPAGVYNVVDDEPLTRRQIDTVLAEAIGRKRLRRPLDGVLGRLGPATDAFTRSMRVSNQRFKDASGWRPTPGGCAAGLRRLVRDSGYADRGLNGLMRLLMWILALSGLSTGVQALFMPRSFFDDFPFGRGWVAIEPPYNEHLVRDVGAFFLALAAITFVAIAIRSPLAARLAGLAWLVFALPHATYHLFHLEGFETADAIGNVLSTWAQVVLAVLVLVLPTAPRRRRSSSPAATASMRPEEFV